MIDFAKMKKDRAVDLEELEVGYILGLGLSDDGYGSRPHGRARECSRSLADEAAEEHLFGKLVIIIQDGRLRLYLPGNGGYLMAVAMMCAGWDGSVHPNSWFPTRWQLGCEMGRSETPLLVDRE